MTTSKAVFTGKYWYLPLGISRPCIYQPTQPRAWLRLYKSESLFEITSLVLTQNDQIHELLWCTCITTLKSISEKKNSPSIMIYMIIYLTPHDPKTPCYHKYCILNRQHTTARFEVHRLHFSYPVSNGIHLILRYFVQGLSVSCIQQVK